MIVDRGSFLPAHIAGAVIRRVHHDHFVRHTLRLPERQAHQAVAILVPHDEAS
jgi:hypothetical protein